MAESVRPFLMFQEGKAQSAIDAYRELLGAVVAGPIERHGADQPGAEGWIRRAVLIVGGQQVMVFDSPIRHAFDFTPSLSLFVECADQPEFDRLAAGLAEGGEFLMPPGAYGFSRKFAWLNDRFGVSWQLNLT